MGRNALAARARPRTVPVMASLEPSDGREFRQMRHDVDDAYRLLTVVQETVEGTRVVVGTVAAAQRRHDTRLEEIQQALDRQAGRPDPPQGAPSPHAERLRRGGAPPRAREDTAHAA